MQWNIRKKFNSKDYLNGIHKIEFGSLIMEHLPVISAQIRECAVSDEENRLMNGGAFGGDLFGIWMANMELSALLSSYPYSRKSSFAVLTAIFLLQKA